MISGELDILKDWCYEAVSTIFLFSQRAKQNKTKICQKG